MTRPGLRQVLAGLQRTSKFRRPAPTSGWQPLACSAEVGRRPLVCQTDRDGLTRTILVWRTRRGRPVAMDARCPHRLLPMTGGRVVGDAIECPFHHRRFGPSGRCVNVRGARPAVVLEVREVAGVLWIEVGGPEV